MRGRGVVIFVVNPGGPGGGVTLGTSSRVRGMMSNFSGAPALLLLSLDLWGQSRPRGEPHAAFQSNWRFLWATHVFGNLKAGRDLLPRTSAQVHWEPNWGTVLH